MISTPTFHPFLSHFPTALFVAGCVLLFLSHKRGQPVLAGAASLNFSLGLLASVLAALSGMFAADLEFRPITEVEGHQGYAFAMVVFLAICTIYSYTNPFSRAARIFYLAHFLALGATLYTGYLLVFQFKG